MQNLNNRQYLCHDLSFNNEIELPVSKVAHKYIRRLQQECHPSGLAVFVATLNRKVSGSLSMATADQPLQHRSIMSIREEKYTMTLHPTSELQVPDLEFDIGNLLVPTCFDGLTPTKEHVEEEEADEVSPGNGWCTAVILIPYQHIYLMIKDFTTPDLVKYFIDRALAEYIPNTDLWRLVKTLCMEADIQSWPEHIISLAIEASLRAEDYEVFEHVARNGYIKSSCDLVITMEKAAIRRPGCFNEPLMQKG
ncbi:hypothetical protein B0T21DRAFT_278200 [Apiosordaria backusii]|uniref:Uncharacterized protein n=1 Tax=Apiosordaria backusii TaxID=314023 RepID=A0AA40EYX0_9PEZI|nr:hypothetical protein B0T21DRAFT_278200 [Apiosordaria backusii]